MAQDVPDRQSQVEPRADQRALARDLPPDRRELSGDRRAGRLAQHLAPDHDAAVAGLGAQRDVGPRAARPHLCAAHLGRTAADRAGLALLRRCADGDRRPRRRRPARHGGQGRGRRQVHGRGAQRGLRHALRPHARGRRGAGGEVERAAQAHRVRAARARARAGRAGAGGRPGREPHHHHPGRAADLRAHRGLELPQRARARPHAGGSQGASSNGRSRRSRRSSTRSPRRSSRPASRAGRAATATTAS